LATFVMKFGGSLVGSKGGVRRVADLVMENKKKGARIVCVVSALGDVTDRLLQAASGATKWDERRIDRTIEAIRRHHFSAVGETSLGESEKSTLRKEIDDILEELRRTLAGVSILRELSPRSKDIIVSFGERLASPVVAAELRCRGVTAPSLTGGEAGIVTDGTFGEAAPLFETIRREARKVLLPKLENGQVPVVAGFIARSKSGEITTLGRGGSDFTATLLGEALGADEVWIWTDVDGIMTADPRVVKSPNQVAELSYAEAEELAFFGAKNMHPLALGPARKSHLPVRIKNGFRPSSAGTLITDRETKSRGIVKVVAVVRDVGLLTVAGETLQGRPGAAGVVFTSLARAQVNALMISQSVSEANIGVVVKRSSLSRAVVSLGLALKKDGIPARVSSEPDISVVAAVGAGMKGERGVAARIFGAVARAGVNVKMIAQGSSELNVSFVVDEDDADGAVRAIHDEVIMSRRVLED
jgi:aspartate kinase